MGEGGVKVYSGVAVVAQMKFFKAVEGGRERGVWVGREREIEEERVRCQATSI